MDDQIEFWRFGEWTMVYLNGRLQRAGDSYLADEWLQARFDVKVVDDDAGTCIPDGRNALETLAEVYAASDERAARVQLAEEKKRQAAILLAEAGELSR